MVIDKEFLKGYKSFLIVFENCDVFEIDMADILDVYCVAELVNEREKEYRTHDGFIKISAKASDAIERSVLKRNEIGTEFDIRLKNRLGMCDGSADMTLFSLRDKRKRDLDIYVPYNPLEDIDHWEIEWSNCPSFDVDDEGNMIVEFGERSKQPKRKDNNYAELVEGWGEFFGNVAPEILQVKIESMLTFGKGQTNYSVAFKGCNKFSKKDTAELVFMDCRNVALEMFFSQKGDCEIMMSRMMDGRIYVGFDGLALGFDCASVMEYEYYCKRIEE